MGRPTTAVIAAALSELSATVKRLKLKPQERRFVGNIAGRRIVAAVTGLGRDRACCELQELWRIYRPQLVIHTGFAGGLNPHYTVGQVITFDLLISEHGEAVRLAARRPPVMNGVDRKGDDTTLLTLDRVVYRVKEKARLFERHGAAAVDMESFHVACLAARLGIRLMALRAIIDAADMGLPPSVYRWIKPDGRADLAPVKRYLITHPWELPAILRLSRCSHLARHALAERVFELLENLPAPALGISPKPLTSESPDPNTESQ